MATVSGTGDLFPGCPCCGGECPQSLCLCCDQAPAPMTRFVSVAAGTLTFDLDGHGGSDIGCDPPFDPDQQSFSPWTGPEGFTEVGGEGNPCKWIAGSAVPPCTLDKYIICEGGEFYFYFEIQNAFFTPGLQVLKLRLIDFTCCDTTQTVDVEIITQDEVYTSVPTQLLITSCGCRSWDCIEDVCVERGDGEGTFSSLFACEAMCPIPESWNCNEEGVCFDPGDGTGIYPTLEDCETFCFPVSFDCVDGSCFDPGDGTGAYATAAACIAAPCAPPATWNCVDGVCVDPEDGTGTYERLDLCEAACPPPPVTYNCIEGVCTDPGDGTGLYSTLEACEAECPPDPMDCSGCPCLATDEVAWTQYWMTVGSITDNELNDCNCVELNGTWALIWNGTTQWETDACTTLSEGCMCAVPTGPIWKLYCDSMTWKVADYLSGVIYVADTFTPTDGGTFTKTGSETFCDNLPATISLAPAGDPFQCE